MTGEAAQTEVPSALLNVPSADRVEYESNLIRLAVCELRFPYLVDYEESLPNPFQKALRKDYPHLATKTNIGVDAGSPAVRKSQRYLLRSRDRAWTVAFSPLSVALETTEYENFEDFRTRLDQVLDAAKPIVDTDFFTRLGLRYINHLPAPQSQLRGWLNPELATPLVKGRFGEVSSHETLVRGYCEGGRFTFRHGYVQEEESDVYVMDADYFCENIEWPDVRSRLKQFNTTNFNLFEWAIGERAREAMGKASPKGRRSR